MGEQLHQCVMEPSDVEHHTGQANSVPNNQNIVAEINEGNGVDEKVIAGLDDVESFAREYKEEWNRASGADHRGSQVEDQASVLGPVPDARLRGVVQEVALNNVFRYPWPVMKSLYHYMLDECLDKVRKTGSKDDTGIKEAIFELHELLDEFEHAPYTVQRLSEVLLEPQKQYSDVEKMLHSLYILLSVTSCHENVHRELPPLPRLGDLVSVNDNPVSPYTGQPPAPPLNAEVDNVLNGDFEEGPQVGYEQ